MNREKTSAKTDSAWQSNTASVKTSSRFTIWVTANMLGWGGRAILRGKMSVKWSDIFFLLWSIFCVWAGYKTCRDIKLSNARIAINGLSFKQAAKWIFIHEQRRHQADIDGIDKDLSALKDIELPEEVLELAGKIRFEV